MSLLKCRAWFLARYKWIQEKKRFIPLVTLDSSEMWNGTNWMAGPVLPSLSVRPCIGDRGNGKVFIHKDASCSDATQLNKNLLLSDDARVNTKPQMEIDNDDVKCGHGATIGGVDPEELFYLVSRGIDRETAIDLIAGGFVRETEKVLESSALKREAASFFEETAG